MSIGINLNDGDDDNIGPLSHWNEDGDFDEETLDEDLQTWPGVKTEDFEEASEDFAKKTEDLLWWGYKHTSGTLQAKRYFGPLDTEEARDSPFCDEVVGPFSAKGREDALEKVKQQTS